MVRKQTSLIRELKVRSLESIGTVAQDYDVGVIRVSAGLLQELESRNSLVRVSIFENGKPTTYRKVPAQAAEEYEKLGLKNGDVITRIDGENVVSSSDGINRLKKMAVHLDKIHEISILRSGKKIQLSLNPD